MTRRRFPTAGSSSKGGASVHRIMALLKPTRRGVIAGLILTVFVVYVYDWVVLTHRDNARLIDEISRIQSDLVALRKDMAQGDQRRDAPRVDVGSNLVQDLKAELRVSADGINDRLDQIELGALDASSRGKRIPTAHTSPIRHKGSTEPRAGAEHLDFSPNWRHMNCSTSIDSQRMIPRIIMQQWHNKSDPRAVIARRIWTRTHPCYTYVMLDNDEIWGYLNTRWPQMIPYLQQGSNIGEKADLIRYLWMYDHGGVYADLDAFALQSLDPLLGGGRTLVVGLEADFKTEKLRDEWLSGAMESATLHCFATSKHNSVLWQVVETVIQRLRSPLDMDKMMEGRTIGDVGTIRTLHRTGPVPFSAVVLKDDRTTVLGVLALQGGHGNGERYYNMMRPASLMKNIPSDIMNPVFAIHINTGTWLSQSGVQGPPDHFKGIEDGQCMHENSLLDVVSVPSTDAVWTREFTLPPGVNAKKTALVVRNGGLFIVDDDIPIVVLARSDTARERRRQAEDNLNAEVAATVARLQKDKRVSPEHKVYMSQAANARNWCNQFGASYKQSPTNYKLCAKILRLKWLEDELYSKRFTDAMLTQWSTAATTFRTVTKHLLTTDEIEPIPSADTSPESFVLGGESTCLSVRVCMRSGSPCIEGVVAEFAVEGWQSRPDRCADDSAVFIVPTADCISGIRARIGNGAPHGAHCVLQLQFVTRKKSVSPWLGRASRGKYEETEATAPRGLCLASIWGGMSRQRPDNDEPPAVGLIHPSAWRKSAGGTVVGLGVTFATPLPVPNPARTRVCVQGGGRGVALFGRDGGTPLATWTSSRQRSSQEETDTLVLHEDRVVLQRALAARGGAAEAQFASVRKGMKAVAATTQAAVTKDVRTNQGKRFFSKARGLVFVSGEGLLPGRPSGIHFSMIYAQLNWLYRVVNTTLPTEVWLMTDADYPVGLDLDFPLVTFRVLATTSIRDWYDITLPGNFFAGTLSYCTKILAVLASDFEEAILLDNDNFAISDPRALFEHPTYKKTGHLVWADAQPRFINPQTVQMLGLTEHPDELDVHSDGGQIAMNRKRYLPGLAAMFHVGLKLGANERYFYGDKDLWRMAFMFQHQAPTSASYHASGTFRHVFNFPSWFGDFDFATQQGGFQRRFHVRGYAQVLSATDTTPAFMHFSGGAKLLLLDMAQRGFKRVNQWSHFLRITDPTRQLHKDVPPVNDLGWCTEAPVDESDILPMPLWIQIKMNWLLDRINESLSIYPVADLEKFIVAHTVTSEYNGCFM